MKGWNTRQSSSDEEEVPSSHPLPPNTPLPGPGDSQGVNYDLIDRDELEVGAQSQTLGAES